MSDDTGITFLDLSQPWVPSPKYLARRSLAKRLHKEAKQIDAPPRYESGKRVKCRGERLHRIYWQGRQWAVTSYGIECRDGCYVIAKHRYEENEPDYGWVMHMSGKEWVDLHDFAEALRIARRLQHSEGAA
jgi:hypothetical protein